MKYVLKHLHVINTHKWEVFKLCVKVGIPFRGLVHDLSKYSITEFWESVKYYKEANGKYSPILACKKDIGYSKAWLHHKGRNKHHFEYWYDPKAPMSMPIIPFKYMLEMICDRIAASKVYHKENYYDGFSLEYLRKEKTDMTLNPKLIKFLEKVFKELSKEGEKILKKKHLLELYNECVK